MSIFTQKVLFSIFLFEKNHSDDSDDADDFDDSDDSDDFDDFYDSIDSDVYNSLGLLLRLYS